MIRVLPPHLSIEAGDILFITGGSGIGKTALLNCFGLLPNFRPEKATQLQFIDADGNPFDPKASDDPVRTRRLRKNEIGHISSHGALFRFLTLSQNICLTRSDPDELKTLTGKLGLDSDGAMLDRHLRRNTPIDIQRKVLVARELIKRPRLLIADDPVSGVCPHTQQRIWETLLKQYPARRPAVIIALRCGSSHAPSMQVLEQAISQGFRLRHMCGKFEEDAKSETRFKFWTTDENGKVDDKGMGMSAEACHRFLVSPPIIQ